jgi:hypothetical protein
MHYNKYVYSLTGSALGACSAITLSLQNVPKNIKACGLLFVARGCEKKVK